MGFFDEDYGLTQAEGYVRQAEQALEARKRDRDSAKKSNNYKNASKNISFNGKVGNSYDYNIWLAQELVKRRKAELAEAKKRANEAKKKKAKKERAEKKAEKEREKERLAEERAEKKAAERSSRSSSRSSSSPSSSSYSSSNSYDDDDDDYSNESSSSSSNTRETSAESELYKLASNILSEDIISRYSTRISRTYPIETASDTDLVKWLPELIAEIKEQEQGCNQNQNNYQIYMLFTQQKEIAQAAAVKACLRLKMLDNSLYNSPDVKKLVQQIIPDYPHALLQSTKGFNSLLKDLDEKQKVMEVQLKKGVKNEFNILTFPFKIAFSIPFKIASSIIVKPIKFIWKTFIK